MVLGGLRRIEPNAYPAGPTSGAMRAASGSLTRFDLHKRSTTDQSGSRGRLGTTGSSGNYAK